MSEVASIHYVRVRVGRCYQYLRSSYDPTVFVMACGYVVIGNHADARHFVSGITRPTVIDPPPRRLAQFNYWHHG